MSLTLVPVLFCFNHSFSQIYLFYFFLNIEETMKNLTFMSSVLYSALLFFRKFSLSRLLLPGYYLPTTQCLPYRFCTCQQSSSIETIMVLILKRQKDPDVIMHTKIQTKSYPSLSSQQPSLVLQDDEQRLACLRDLLCSLPLCSRDNISTPALLPSYKQLCTEV